MIGRKPTKKELEKFKRTGSGSAKVAAEYAKRAHSRAQFKKLRKK